MAESKESYIAENDYTLSVVTVRKLDEDSSFKVCSVITRSFNFLAQQVTTHVRDTALGNAGGYKYGGAGAIATALSQQHFDDFRSDAEIIFMHKKLVELGGKPPALDDITRGIGRKNTAVPALKATSP